MRTLLKSPLKTAANNITRIGFTPKARRVRALDFDRRSEYKTFADWIKSSTEDLTESPLPSKRELKKLVNFEVAGGGGGGLLGLLGGLGGIGLGALGLEGFLGDKMPKIKIPYRRPKPKPRGRNRGGNQGRGPGRPGDRSRDSRNNRNNRRTRNNTTQRPGRTGPMSDAERRYRRRFGDKAGDRKFGPRQQGRVQNRGLTNPLRQRPNVTGTGADRFRQGVRSNIPGQGARVTGGNLDRALNTGPLRRVQQVGKFGLQGGKAVLRASKSLMRVFSRVPIIGALIAGVLTYFQDIEGGNNPELPGGGPNGQPDMKLDKALFSAGGAALGGIIGSFIPIPVIGTLLGGFIGEYIGDLAYMIIKGDGFQAAGQKLMGDLKKLLSVGPAIANWAKQGFDRFYEGFPKINVFGMKILDLSKTGEGLLKLPRAFFTKLPMNETKEQEAERLKKEEEIRKKVLEEEKANRGQESDQLPYTTTEDGEVVPIGPVDEPVTAEQDLQLTPMSDVSTVDVGLNNLVSVAAMTGRSDPGGPIMTSGRGMRGGRHHAGVDIGTGHQRGWYVAFRLKGKVSLVQYLSGYGNTVIIEADGKDFLFAHLARQSDLRPGQSYNGQIIGEIGNTGAGTGEHLHFEVRTAGGGSGTDMDPMPYVKYLMIGKLGSGTPQTLLARADARQTVADDGTITTTNRRGRQVKVSPDTSAQRTGNIERDPKVNKSKTQTLIIMESLAKMAKALGGGQEEKPQVAVLPVPNEPSPRGRGSMNVGNSMVSSASLLNNYWQTTLLSKLSS